MDPDERFEMLARLLHDDTLEPTDRVAGSQQLASLQRRIESDPQVAALQTAQDQLRTACQEAADLLSTTAGIDLANSCGPGGCG